MTAKTIPLQWKKPMWCATCGGAILGGRDNKEWVACDYVICRCNWPRPGWPPKEANPDD